MGMRFVYGFLMVVLSTAMPAFAQEQGGGGDHQPPSAEEIVQKMQTNLNLTQDQVTAISPIIQKYLSKREELRQSMEDGTEDRDNLRSQMKQLREDENQELGQVLSKDQMDQWKEMQSKMHHPKPEGSSDH